VEQENQDAMEYPVRILKVQWSHHTEKEATWEREEELNAEFLNFFSDPSECRG
jgi:hypothetical protein